MSEPQLISPLLDGFIMGDPISNHDGIRCCPAMQMETERKYIVKVISIPASQSKLDALLLAGAFSDKSSALAYFKDLADGVADEAALLQQLSRLEGFVSYEGWQVVPMEDEAGYDIYLLGAYRPTLEYRLQRGEMTHLGAVNLGLDLCAALAVCRRLGYLYANLKPSNVYIRNDREYRIGDIGFIRVDSLPYVSLPEQYRSSYTPPEIPDAYSTLNDTMDVYAVGRILYQAYNDGKLPESSDSPPAPCYADAEMAQIILKACAADPQERWKDPTQMGQALVEYLQRNEVNDVPIIPVPVTAEVPEEEPVQTDAEPSTDQILAEVDQALEQEEQETPAEPPAEETAASEEGTPAEEAPVEEIPPEEEPPTEEATAEEPDNSVDDSVPEGTDIPEESSESVEDTAPEEETVSDDAPTADEAEGEPEENESPGETSEASAEDKSESTDSPAEEGANLDTAEILAQADDIIAHQLPDPVVAPEPIEVPIPAPIPAEDVQEPTEESDDASPSDEASPEADTEEKEDTSESTDETPAEESEIQAAAKSEDTPAKSAKRHRKGLIITVSTLLVLILLGLGGYLFYEHYYLQPLLDINLQGSEDKLTVVLNSEIDDQLLTVICTDPYGNTLRTPVEDGAASFEALRPGTAYKIQVQIDGFHKLTGKTQTSYTTPNQTVVSDFQAVTGSENGSVILSFTVQGPENSDWMIEYSAADETPGQVTFSGHMTTITGLTVGKEYTFRLKPVEELYLSGTDSITYVPSKIITASNLTVLGFTGNSLTAVWEVPEGASVASWSVRCYNDAGFDQIITVTEPKAVFENLDPNGAYTVEVTAESMTASARAYVSANSVTIHEITVDSSNKNQLTVNWKFEGTAPEGGWLLLYTVDGMEQQVVKCDGTSGVILPQIPGGHYAFTIQAANGVSVFSGTLAYEAPAASAFSGYLLKADDISLRMCVTPNVPNWNRYNVANSAYTTSFAPGVSASFVMTLMRDYKGSSDNIVTLYAIRDSSGNLVSCATESRTWSSMWHRGYGKLTIPFMPKTPGQYTVEIFFNGASVAKQNFEITAA